MDVGANGGVDSWIKFEVGEVVGLLLPSMKLYLCSKHCTWHAHLLISSIPTFFHSTKPLCLIPPHLMSLFSTPIMFPSTFLSRFLLGSLIMGSPTCMKHKQPFTLH
jgi:hypothetical protein